MSRFVITTKDGRKFTTSRYINMSHLESNAWVNEGGVFCDNDIFVSISHIQMIEPAVAEPDNTDKKGGQ